MDDLSTLRVFARQHASRQWRCFLASIVAELSAQVEAADLVRLLRRTGQRMAQALPLPACSTLDELQAAIGAVWAGMEWGAVELAEREKFLTVSHLAYPQIAAGQSGETGWIIPVLEGVYTEWLNAQSGEPAFKARRLEGSASTAHAAIISYGLIAD